MIEAPGPFADFFGRLWRQKPLGIASAIVILILIMLAIFADALAPYPVDQLNLAERLQGSSTRHLLGTDQLGRDLLSRLLFGARISLVVGLAATTLNVLGDAMRDWLDPRLRGGGRLAAGGATSVQESHQGARSQRDAPPAAP